MKTVILTYCLTRGGAERVAAMWANGFNERGDDVYVIIFNDDLPRTYTLHSGIKLLCITSHRKNRWVRVIERIVKLRIALKRIKPDASIEVMPEWQRTVAMLGLGFVKISTEHQPFEHPEHADKKVNKFSKFWLNRLYDHVTVLTQADKEVIGKKLKHVTVLPNPLALTPTSSVTKKDKIVLAVGRKDAWLYKGFDNLVKAWSRVTAEVKGWKLQIVGSSNGEGQEYLTHLCRELDIENSVEFPDYQTDIQPYYQRAAIFVLSSRYEGFGLVLIEAMSQGCACIACDYKGRQSEIVTNGVDGMTCEPDHVEALAQTIKKLIADDELRAQLQVNAIQRAGDFSIGHIMARWEGVFKECGLR